ncbi:MAG: DNA methyltransferase, partial [Desulfosalsimonas sp.]
MCVNIGDAVRKLGDSFSLYPNHSEIIRAFLSRGLTPLPAIIWRKQTNAPNKFMGSGMLPAGAYVTLEHEYVLIFRKGAKRQFATPAQKLNRKKSAIFWEERNQWYSDVWFDL